MAHEVADLIIDELKAHCTIESLTKKIEDKLIFETRLLEGLRRLDGGTISEMLTHKIRDSGISQKISKRAVAEWENAEPGMIFNECREELYFQIKRAARAK